MKRLLILLVACAFATSACATQSSLWGVQATPTPRTPTATVPATETAIPTITFTPLPTGTNTLVPTEPVPTQTLVQVSTPQAKEEPILYYAQSGDNLEALAKRFSVAPTEITSPRDIPQTGLIEAGILLIIPDRIEGQKTPNVQIMPDSEVVFSASASKFDVGGYIANAGGYLSSYKQWITSSGTTSGTDVLTKLTRDNSANPRLLLALLEYESGWVFGQPPNIFREKYPLGFQIQDDDQGLHKQLQWAMNQLYAGYYGWRAGTLTEIEFPDGEKLRLSPDLNAGTVALQYFFSRQRNRAEWERVLDPNSPTSFVAYYNEMFGDPWAFAATVEPLFPPINIQPPLVLPFEQGVQWNYTSGPHGAWDREGPLAAVDFAPPSDHKGCDVSFTWVTASAAGRIVRSDEGPQLMAKVLDNARHWREGLHGLGFRVIESENGITTPVVPVLVEESPLPMTPEGTRATARGAIAAGAAGVLFGERIWTAADGPRLTAGLLRIVHGLDDPRGREGE